MRWEGYEVPWFMMAVPFNTREETESILELSTLNIHSGLHVN